MSPARSRSGGTLDREDGEAVVEVLAKALLAHGLEQVAIGRGNDPDIDPDRRRAADPIELALLEDAEQLDLSLERQFADLVEEESAAVGQFEAADSPRDGAGEGSLLVAEQLALDEPDGQGGAVDLDQRLVARAGSSSGWRGRSAPCPCRSRHGSVRWHRWRRRGRSGRAPPARRDCGR